MPSLLANYLPQSAITTRGRATNWREAIGLAGQGLVVRGAVTPKYIDEMIATVEEHGPYIVIAPGIALAHARPSAAVIRPALALATLEHPVDFGSQNNDPVDTVFALAATDPNSHLELMAALAGVLGAPSQMSLLRGAQNSGEIRGILSGKRQPN